MKKLLILIAFFALITSNLVPPSNNQNNGVGPHGNNGQGPNPNNGQNGTPRPQSDTIDPQTLTKNEVETSVNSNGNPFTVEVPHEHLRSAKEYGFALWLKASYLQPAQFNFDALQQSSLGIAGIYENGDGYCGFEIGKRALSVELLQAGFSLNPSFLFNTYSIATRDNGDEQLEFPTREDFDHEWNYIYYSYSYEQSRAFSYVYFSHSDLVITHNWDNQIKRQPIPQLNFRLGGCSQNSQNTFQGLFSNVAFFYGPTGSGLFLDDTSALDNFRNGHQHATQQPQLTTVEVDQLIGNQAINVLSTTNDERDHVLYNLNGVNEYAVWGWAKWIEPENRDDQHTLFRLTSDDQGEFQDDSKVGDRTLAAFIGNNQLVFSTYSFDWAGSQPAPDFSQSIDTTAEALSQWFYIYFGYSQDQQQAFAFVKFQNGEASLTWDGAYHMRPDQLVLQLGNDDFHQAFNGKLQNWNFAHGPGAYFKQGFETYYSVAVFTDEDVETVVTEAPEEVVGYPETYETGFKSQNSAYHYVVPDEELPTVQDVSLSFWFRWNYQFPEYANIEELKANQLSMAHISETDSTGTNFGDRLLSVWLKPLMYGRKILWLTTYARSSGRPNYGQDAPIRDDADFDGAWTWLYYAYSRSSQSLFAYIRFQSGQVLTKSWRNCDHTYPPQSLHLRVGKSSYSAFTFNGEFFNVEFQHQGQNYLGTREEVEAYYNGPLIKPRLGPVEFHDELVQLEPEEFEGGSPEQGKVLSTYDGAQATQYSVYGWSKWTPTQAKQDKHVMFRLSTDEEDQIADKAKPGDRTLMYYVGDGVLVAATYTYSFTSTDPNLNSVKTQIPYEDDLETWYWIYFGYNLETKRAFTFVRFYDRVYSFTFDGIVHLIPRRFRFTLGDDQFLYSYNGVLQDWHLTWGVGAYRENNFEELYGTGFAPANQPDLGLDNSWTLEPHEVNSFADETEPVVEQDLTSDELATGVRQYSFSFWSRFAFLDPQKVDVDQVLNNDQAMAGITEQDGFNQAGQGAKALSLYLKSFSSGSQPTFKFSTYSTNRNQDDDFKELAFSEEDLDSQWNWVYFGYNLDYQRAQAVVYYSRTRQTQTLVWEQTVHNLPQRLKFQLGKPQGDTALGFNGIFYDVRFRFDQLAYKEGVNINNYFASSVRVPPFYRPSLSKLALTDGVVDFDLNTQAGDNFYQYPSAYRGATQYSVYGWAKWTETANREIQHSIFRLTTNTPSQAQDRSSFGDRTLACFVSRNTLQFSTYTYGLSTSGNDDSHDLNWEVEYEDDLTAWFFVYFGYSKQEQKAKVFIKFQDREEQYVFNNVKHASGKYFGLYLAKDRFYPSFNGQFNQWVFSVGDGSYQESDYEQLYTLVVDESDNREYTQSTIVDVVENQNEDTVVQTTLYEEEVPQDQLSGTNTATVWTWFSWGFNTPRYFGNPANGYGNCYHVTRLVYGPGKGVYADLCFSNEDGSAFVKFTETSGDQEVVQNAPLPSFDDLDNAWNFVYMTHDQTNSLTTVYVYFAKSQQRWVYSFPANWYYNDYIRFKLGGGATDGRRLFNGRFFDAQMSTYFRYSAHDVAGIAVVQTKVTVIPSEFRTDSLDTTAETISFTTQNDGEVVTDDSVNTPVTRQLNGYSQITTYSLRGWARWTGSAGWDSNRLVHRLTQHNPQDLTDDQQPGDRALTLFLQTDGRLAFSTYNYQGRSGNNNLIVSTDLDVRSKVTNWFFVYHGYSFVERRSFVFVRFGDDTEFSQVIENVRQIQSNTYGMYLGRDSLFSAWRGRFYSYSFTAGGNSFISNALDARNLQTQTTTVVFRWVNVNVDEPQTVETEPTRQTTATPSVVQRQTRVWRSVSPRGRVINNVFENTYEGYSYFLDEENTNEEYKLVISEDFPEGASICFGFIPSTLTHLITENPEARYMDDAISVCSNGEQYNCFGAGQCTNGVFETTAGSTYLWRFQDDQVVLRKQPNAVDSGCVLVDERATTGDVYTGDDSLCYYDVIRFLDYEGPQPEPQYQCSFSRERRCLEEGQRDFLVPYVELRGPVSVQFVVDEFGNSDLIDTTEQSPCQDTTLVEQNSIDCDHPVPPPTPPVTPPQPPVDPLPPTITPPTPTPPIFPPPPAPVNCDEAPTFNAENLHQLWQSEQGYASNVLVNPDAVQLTYTSDDPANGNANYQVTFPATTGSFCIGYHTESNENDLIAICSNGTRFNYDGSYVCLGQLRLNQGNTFAVTVQGNFVQITTSNQNFQCNLDRPTFNYDILLPWVHYNFDAEVNVHLQSTGGIDCPMGYLEEPVIVYPLCDEARQVQSWDYEASHPEYDVDRFGVVDALSLVNDDPENIRVFFSPDTNALASYEVTLVRYQEELAKYVCFGYIDPSFEDSMRDAPGESRWTDSISACTDTTTNNAFDGTHDCSGHFDDYQGARFRVDITDTTVTIRQLKPIIDEDTFICSFNRDPEVQYIPWIEIDGLYAVEAPFTGCTDYVPQNRNCEDDFDNASQLDGTTWSNTIDFTTSTNGQLTTSGQYASIMNRNANFIITLPEDTGKVCFGFVTVNQWNNDISANYDVFYEPPSNKICNDEDFESNGNCVGHYNGQRRFTATVQEQSTQFTSYDNQLQCNFQRNGDQSDLLPWVLVEQIRGDPVQVELTGLGGMNCPVNINVTPRTPTPTPPTVTPPPPPTPTITPPPPIPTPPPVPGRCDSEQRWTARGAFASQTLHVLENTNDELGGQFYSKENAGAQFTVTVNGNGVPVCFGYATPSVIAQFDDVDENQLLASPILFSYGIGICTDGSVYNYNGGQPEVNGDLDPSYSSLFFVYFDEQNNKVKVSTLDRQYWVDLPLPESENFENLVPWISLNGQTRVVANATCENPYFAPPPEIQACSQSWKSTYSPHHYTDVSDEDGVSNHQSQYGIVQYWSPINQNMQFAATFRHNDGESGVSCVGFVPLSQVSVLEQAEARDFRENAVGFCTDNSHFNVFQQQNVCRGDVSVSSDEEFYVWRDDDYVNVRSSDDTFECIFRVEGDLIPWVQQYGRQSVLTKITCEDPPQCETTCEAWNDTSRVQQDWERFQQAAYSFESFLRNDGQDSVSYVSGINQNANYKVTLNQDFAAQEVCFGYVSRNSLSFIVNNPTRENSQFAVGLCSNNQTFNTYGNVSCEGLNEFSFNGQFGNTYRSIVRANTVQIFSVTGDRGNFACTFDRNENETLVPWVQLGAGHSVVAAFDGLGGHDCEEAQHFCGYVPPPPPPVPRPECAYLYSECNYQGVSFQICGDGDNETLPEQCNGAVLSIWLPPGAQVNLQCLEQGEVDCGGRSVAFDSSERCMSRDTRLQNIGSAQFVQKEAKMTTITNFKNLKEEIEKSKSQQLSLIQMKNGEGDCVTLYSECGFKGKSQQVCNQQPNKVLNAKSLTIPHGWQVEMFDDKEFRDYKATYSYDVDCLTDQHYHLKFDNKITKQSIFVQMSDKKSKHLKKNRL